MSNKEWYEEVADEVNKWAKEELERRGILMASEVVDKFADMLEQRNPTKIKETNNILNQES